MAITLEEYKQRIRDVISLVQTKVITPVQGNSTVSTRYITSEGLNDEDWIGFLRNENDVVDIFLIDLSALLGLPPENKGMIGGFDKPLDIYIDYFSDYRVKGDTQDKFLFDKVIPLDFYLENNYTLTDNVFIQSYDIRCSIKKFSSASCHRAQIVLNLLLTANLLQ